MTAWSPLLDKSCGGPDSPDRRKVALWGDSFAGALFHGLRTLAQGRDDISLGLFSLPACAPLPEFKDPRRPHCEEFNRSVLARITALVPDTVIVVGNWTVYRHETDNGFDFAMLDDVIARLAAIGVRRIVVLGQFPMWEFDVPRIRIPRYREGIARDVGPATDLNRAVPPDMKSLLEDDVDVRNIVAGRSAIFISPLTTLCNDRGCLLAVPGRPQSISSDRMHLSAAGSDYFAATNADALFGR